MSELLRVEHLSMKFEIDAGFLKRPLELKVLQDIDFSLAAGETLGIVGESGSGKSTLGRCILNLVKPHEGRVLWLGQDLAQLGKEAMRLKRRELQVIFQDPLASLDPRMTVGSLIAEPLRSLAPEVSAGVRHQRVLAMMEAVGLAPEMANRYPHEFSGGQAQRIGIARALITEPKLIVCDEPVSALDVSIQAQILNLLSTLKQQFGLTLIFISHNLSVVRHIADRILVLYLGRIVEMGPSEVLHAAPRHPYTRALLSAAPIADPRYARAHPPDLIYGEIPSPLNQPSGCTFRTRCRYAKEECAAVRPLLEPTGEGSSVACHRWRVIDLE